MVNTERVKLLDTCRTVISRSEFGKSVWLLGGSFGREEDVWHRGAPISDLDLVLVTPVFRTSRIPALYELQAAYQQRNPCFSIDIKQVRTDALAGLAGTLFAHDLTHAKGLLTGDSVHRHTGVLQGAPTMASAYYLLANRYLGWVAEAGESAMRNEAGYWVNTAMRHRTCDLVFAVLTAYVIRAGRYSVHLAARVGVAADVLPRPRWVEIVQEAYSVRTRPGRADQSAGELWRAWSDDVLDMLTTLGPIGEWPAEAAPDGVQSLPPSSGRTPTSAKAVLQHAAVLLAHSWANPGMRTELDAVSGLDLPGWLGTWSQSRSEFLRARRQLRTSGAGS